MHDAGGRAPSRARRRSARRTSAPAVTRSPPAGMIESSVRAVDVLHDDEVDAVVRIDVVDGDDVRVVERAREPGLLDEAPLSIRVGDSVGGKDLDGHRAIEVGVAAL